MKTLFICGFLICFLSLTAQRNLSGTVVDENGVAMTGAAIRVIGAPGGTISDLDGQFVLKLPDEAEFRISVSFLGYENQDLLITNQQEVKIQLIPKPSKLSEVVIIGFGTQSRKRITSAIVSANAEDFKGIPATTFEDGLQGKLPGVVFTRTTGAQASDVAIRVRGVSSINANNQPLIVIDGLLVEGLNGFDYGATSTNPLIGLNPNDIESVQVLKDGASSAIYGSRGGNGVILITTKRGKFDAPPKVNLHFYAGYSEPSNRYDMLNGKEYAAFWNQSVRNIGKDEKSGLIYDVDKQVSTDWYSLVTRKAFLQETGASVTGGSNATRYYIGGTFRQEDSYYISKGLKRYSFRANIDQMIGTMVKAGFSLNPSRTVHQRIFEGGVIVAPNTNAPSYPPNVKAFDENGKPRREIIYTDIGINVFPGNPLTNLLETNDRLTTTQFLLNTYIEYSPLPFLKLRTELGTEYSQIEELLKNSSVTDFGYPNGSGDAQSQQINSYNWTVQGTYNNSFSNSHEFDITVGSNLTARSVSGFYISGSNYPDDRLLYINAASNINGWGGFKTDNAFAGFFSRINYAFNNRYLLTLSGRYDGSSRFGAKNRFGFFPALSAGWIVSKENFFNKMSNHFLKLRGSIGLSGNGDIFDFAGRSLIDFAVYADNPAAILATLENDHLKWEKTRQIDFGLDFGLWNNRIQGTLEYYVKDTRGLLLNVPLPGTNGITYTLQNAGAVRNQGFEFDLSSEIMTGDFKWRLNLNGATLRNRIRKLIDNNGDGKDDDIVNGNFIFRTGEPINAWYLTRYEGVDPKNGDALYLDKDGNTVPIIPPASGRVIAGTAIPKFTGGITNSYKWKAFDLSIFFQLSIGNQLYRDEGRFIESMASTIANQRRTQLAAWTPENPITNIPQARLGVPNGDLRSTRFLDNADYLRLRNIQLGYTFSDLGKRKGNLRLYASAQNIWIKTGYDGLEPEASLFNPGSPLSGIQFFPSAQPRTIIFGANFDF